MSNKPNEKGCPFHWDEISISWLKKMKIRHYNPVLRPKSLYEAECFVTLEKNRVEEDKIVKIEENNIQKKQWYVSRWEEGITVRHN